jgi:hypothetical protein
MFGNVGNSWFNVTASITKTHRDQEPLLAIAIREQ